MSKDEYPKIETLYNRDKDTFKVTDEIRMPEFELVKYWHITEKIDGTNIRLVMDGLSFEVKGRTDNAQLNPALIEHLYSLKPAISDWYGTHFGEAEEYPKVTIFGEGYGPKIQSGGGYRDDLSFRMFDVKVGHKWLDWPNVEEVAKEIGAPTAPVLLTNVELDDLLLPITSDTADQDGGKGVTPEGIVARTVPYLYDWRGRRIMFKLKWKDLADEN